MGSAVEIVRNFCHIRVLVIGDAILDTYLAGTADRLCSEGPVPVVRKTSENRVPGGAANVAANLRSLEADVRFLGVIGQDLSGSIFRQALRERGVDDRWLIEDPEATTLHKLRILADGQYVVRFDEGKYHTSPESQARVLEKLDEAFSQSDVVVVSDYCYGVVSDAVLERLREERPSILLVDSKDLQRFRHTHPTVITPNLQEARLLAGTTGPLEKGLDAELEQLGRKILDLVDTEHVAITLAAEGVYLQDHKGRSSHLPAHPVAQANDVGAGDSFASAFALALACQAEIEEAAQIGIDAASIAVSKRWTSVITRQELLQKVSLRERTHQGERRFSPDVARLVERLDAERRAGRKIVFTNGVFDILHAGHVEFLRQAKALGDILVVGINRDRSAQRLKGTQRPINSEWDRVSLVSALELVDHVVLFDEDTPEQLIRTLRPHLHVKGGDYAQEVLPEAEAVQDVGGQVIILPLAGDMSTSRIIERIVSLANVEPENAAASREIGVEP
jgi:D-beta-D-heptose 7-phosphate kinase/D-beta-D-heptose 1-phosphate adenosyltransferase